MVHHVGSCCHPNSDDVVLKLTVRVLEGDSCDVFSRLNDLGLHKLPHEFPQEKGNLILQITNLRLICLKHAVKVTPYL